MTVVIPPHTAAVEPVADEPIGLEKEPSVGERGLGERGQLDGHGQPLPSIVAAPRWVASRFVP